MNRKKRFILVACASLFLVPTTQKASNVAEEVFFTTFAIGAYGALFYGFYKIYGKVKEYKGYKIENIEVKAKNSEATTENINLKAENSEIKNQIAQMKAECTCKKSEAFDLAAKEKSNIITEMITAKDKTV